MAAIAKINTQALRHNLSCVRRLAPHSQVMAMVKANAYGHGDIIIAQALPNVDCFGVSSIDEALHLRANGIEHQPIVLMTGPQSIEMIKLCAVHHIDIVVHQHEHIEWLKMVNMQDGINVWLKIDTGMHRLGFEATHAQQAYHQLIGVDAVNQVHVMTHLACANLVEISSTTEQLRLFNQHVPKVTNLMCSVANSAAVLVHETTHADVVRVGLMLYGAAHVDTKVGMDYGLKPVMTLTAPVISIKMLKAGDSVGYEGRWSANKPTKIAILHAGYGDGYPQLVAKGAYVLIHQEKAPILGLVSMDMMAIDITHVKGVSIGSEATLWGDGLPVEQVANMTTRTAYSLLTGVSARVQRVAHRSPQTGDVRAKLP